MNDATTHESEEDNTIHDVSDEMLEQAGTAGAVRAEKTGTGWLMIFC